MFIKFTKTNEGFTLIELLVVVAIIGLLASVVIASLNTARTKGNLSAVQSNLYNAHAQGELFYVTNNTYAGLCAGAQVGGVDPINKFADAALDVTNSTTTVYTAGSIQNTTSRRAICRANPSSWVISVPVDSSVSSWWCVDSTGANQAQTDPIAASTYVCP
jgi:prepilin-type N-terminal cleavage/methylation domain-containing protein